MFNHCCVHLYVVIYKEDRIEEKAEFWSYVFGLIQLICYSIYFSSWFWHHLFFRLIFLILCGAMSVFKRCKKNIYEFTSMSHNINLLSLTMIHQLMIVHNVCNSLFIFWLIFWSSIDLQSFVHLITVTYRLNFVVV